MNSLTKFKLRIGAYSKTLRRVESESTYFSNFHFLYITLIEDVFKLLLNNNQIERKDEFILDFELFASEMKRKYSSPSNYGYEPRSPIQKARGLDYDQKPDEKPRIVKYPIHDDDYGL